jgi:hypothetical protein
MIVLNRMTTPVLGILFPVFAVILCGWAAGRFQVLGRAGAETLNRFTYYFALPPLLFTLTAEARLADILNWPFILAYLGGALATLLVALAGGRLVFGHRSLPLVFHGLAAVFPNTAYLGIPLFVTAFGERGTLPAVVATITSNMVFVGGAVAVAEFRRASGRRLEGARAALFRNPLLIASLAGILWSAGGAPLAGPVAKFLHLAGAAASPAALFAMGLFLVGVPWRAGLGEVCWLSALKLVVQPAVTWVLVSRVFVPAPLWQASAVMLGGMPVGALVFVVTRQYDTYVERASAAIVVSTLASALSLGALLWLVNVR